MDARLAAFLSSPTLAVLLLLSIAIACAIGTFLPQGADVGKFLAAHPDKQGVFAVLAKLGLTNVYSAPWFTALLGALGLSLVVCSSRRCLRLLHTRKHTHPRAIAFLLTHVSFILVLAGALIRLFWGQSGMMALEEGQVSNRFEAADGTRIVLPFSLELVAFTIETHDAPPAAESPVEEKLRILLPGTDADGFPLPIATGRTLFVRPGVGAVAQAETTNDLAITVLQQVMDFAFDNATRSVISRSEKPNNPALQVQVVRGGTTNQQWVFARFPDFDMHTAGTSAPFKLRYERRGDPPPADSRAMIKDYKSHLKVLENGRVTKEKVIEVNDPLRHAGYTVYQSGYDQHNLAWTSLRVTRDPGVPVVYAGFLLMIIGLAAGFFMPQPKANPAPISDTARESVS